MYHPQVFLELIKRTESATYPILLNSTFKFLAEFLEEKEAVIRKCYEELISDSKFLGELKQNPLLYIKIPPRYPLNAIIWHIITRVMKPSTVVETGIYYGWSSACILNAMEKNNRGKLYSIDLPGTVSNPIVDASSDKQVKYELPNDLSPGFLMPRYLRKRWEVRLGKSTDLLEPLLNELGNIDIFVHDSEHSYENMTFELTTAFPHIVKGGMLLAHDINWNNAFDDFSSCKSAQSTSLSLAGTETGFIFLL